MRTIALIALLLLLAACGNPRANYLKQAETNCAGLGLTPGTDSYALCVQNESRAIEQRVIQMCGPLCGG